MLNQRFSRMRVEQQRNSLCHPLILSQNHVLMRSFRRRIVHLRPHRPRSLYKDRARGYGNSICQAFRDRLRSEP